jgi:putative component of membrane protein insertase Oxa1/YidC/SpoIIIJ protein YidD
MIDALKIHGPFIGFALGTNRILRCRPGGTLGYDPVPLFRFKKYKSFSHYEKCSRLK